MSCSKAVHFDSHISSLSESHKFIDPVGWELTETIPYELGIEFRAKRKLNQQAEEILYFTFENGDYRLFNYTKESSNDSTSYVIRMIDHDTAYSYNKNIMTDKIVFIQGYYRYLYFEGLYTPSQLNYYFENKDSLNQIHGNNLPELPDL